MLLLSYKLYTSLINYVFIYYCKCYLHYVIGKTKCLQEKPVFFSSYSSGNFVMFQLKKTAAKHANSYFANPKINYEHFINILLHK